MNTTQAWATLAGVPDPEVPVLSVVDLGIVRALAVDGDDVAVTLTPTYSGCPATEVIQDSVVQALREAGRAPGHGHGPRSTRPGPPTGSPPKPPRNCAPTASHRRT